MSTKRQKVKIKIFFHIKSIYKKNIFLCKIFYFETNGATKCLKTHLKSHSKIYNKIRNFLLVKRVNHNAKVKGFLFLN